MEGPTLHDRNNIAVGVSWAAEWLAIAYLDARVSARATLMMAHVGQIGRDAAR